MLKGRIIHFNSVTSENPLSAVINNYKAFQEDSTVTNQTNTGNTVINTPKKAQLTDSFKTNGNYSQAKIDSLFRISEQRERQILQPPKQASTAITVLPRDTISTKYNLYNTPFTSPQAVTQLQNNYVLSNIPNKSYSKTFPAISNSQQKEESFTTNNLLEQTTLPLSKSEPQKYMESTPRLESGMNWLVIVLLGSLFILSWIKKLYQKYLVQIVSAVVDYQISNRLFRERNVLFRNVSFGLYLIFGLNIGLFIFYLIDFTGNPQLLPQKFASMLIYTAIVLFVYTVKSGTNRIIGYIFLAQEEFAEYNHNVNIFNKNIGLFLLPVVIAFPFIHEKLQPVVLYFGIGILIIMFLLRFYRGLQIIIRKGVSIFYLILYLCAIEILPVLLLLKLSSTWI
jgi:hypothetical protein